MRISDWSSDVCSSDLRRERLVLEVAQLLRADRRLPGDQNEFVGRRKLHDFARGQQCARGFLPADHDMCKPGRETVAGIIAHRTLLGRGAECVGNPLRGPLVIGREGDPDMAIVEYGVVLAIGLFDLVEADWKSKRLNSSH